MIIPVLLALAGGLACAGLGWIIGYDVGYRQARRDMYQERWR